MAFLRSVGVTLEMIRWEHSIFALPFALTGAMLAADGWPTLPKLLWIVVCMVAARSSAMAFNRWADADLDAANPRTRTRAIPAGLLTRKFAAGFTIAMSAVFLLGAAEAQPARAAAGAAGPGHSVPLLVHQALHPLVASVSGPGAGPCPYGRMDRHPRHARPPHSGSHCRRAVLGGWIRRALRLPG